MAVITIVTKPNILPGTAYSVAAAGPSIWASTIFSENLETESTVPETENDLADNEEELEIEADEENGEKEEDTEGESDGDKEEFPDIQVILTNYFHVLIFVLNSIELV